MSLVIATWEVYFDGVVVGFVDGEGYWVDIVVPLSVVWSFS